MESILTDAFRDWRRSYYIPLLISTIGASIEVFLIWGFARSLWSLSLFALAFGSTAGGFAVLRPRFAAEIVGNQGQQDRQSLLVFAILTASRGTAIVGSGFVMKSLVRTGADTVGWGGGLAWSRLVVYTGSVMLVASLGALGWFLRQRKKSVGEVKELDGEEAREGSVCEKIM